MTLANRDVVERDGERALGKAEPAHAVGEPRGAEPDLRELEAVADVHQPCVVGNFQSVELELAVPAVLLRPHDRNPAHDAPPRLVAIEQERGQALARVVARLRNQDEVLRDACASDEPLATVHDPSVAAPLRARANHRRIGAAAGMRLGHRERAAHAPVDDRREPALLLLRRRHFREHGHVAVVRCRAVEAHGTEDRRVHLLVARRAPDHRQAESAELARNLRRPQAGRLHFALDAVARHRAQCSRARRSSRDRLRAAGCARARRRRFSRAALRRRAAG